MRCRGPVLLGLMFLVPMSLWCLPETSVSTRKIPVITIDDAIISPVVAEYVVEAIDRAERAQAPALVMEIDTPGGLLSSTRVIVKRMLNANVPILVYVAPSGSRAGSAGVFITLASHVAAMAPSTNIGAAHPVELGDNPRKDNEGESLKELLKVLRRGEGKKGEKGAKKEPQGKKEDQPRDIMSDKIVNDTVAWIRTIAQMRGRNADWATRAVTESISSSETEAVRLKVVDFVAKDLDEFLQKAEGTKVRLVSGDEVTLDFAGASVERNAMTLRQRILSVLINPNIAYLLMMLGFYGLLFEMTHPGVWVPGVAGLICLILAFYAFQTLPTNYAGLSLIVISIGLFIAETQITSFGLLSAAGILCMLLGSLFLINSTADFMQISLRMIIPVVLSSALIFFFLARLAFKAGRKTSVTGVEALVGLEATVVVALPQGKVEVGGETWNAVSQETIDRGEKVRIISVNGMNLTVKRI